MKLLLRGEMQSTGPGIPGSVHPQLLLQLMLQPRAQDRPQLALQTRECLSPGQRISVY